MKKRILSFITLFCLALGAAIPSSAAGTDSGAANWYCVRRKEHKQPVADPPLAYVETLDGYYADKKHGDTDGDKVVYLTFDAGYENGNVAKILDTLREKNVPAAFFVLENLVCRNTDLVKRMANEGHLVCNHTARHHDMTRADKAEFDAELTRLESVYREKTGRELAKYYRPPEGRFNRASLEYAKDLGYKTVFWSFAYADWDNGRQPDPARAVRLILDNLHNGEVMLLHPTSATNAAILPSLIDAIREAGYRFGTLDECTAEAKI